MLVARYRLAQGLAVVAAASLALAMTIGLEAQSGKPGKGAAAVQQPPRVTSTDPALRLKGFDQHQAMKAASPFKDLKWQFLGPKNISGRIHRHRRRRAARQAATRSTSRRRRGGLWKTENEATTWTPVFEQGPATTIGDVAVAPSNPNIVWMGTGEANIFRSSQAGAGVYKSVDAGKTWQHMGLTDTYTIPRIVIHPTNPDIVYVAASGHEWTNNAERGVYKTADGGKTWEKVLFVSDKTGAIDLAMDPADPNTLYASDVAAHPPEVERPAQLPRLRRQRHLQVDGRRARRGRRSTRACPRRSSAAGSASTCAARSRTCSTRFVDNYEIAREPTEEEKNDPYGVPSSGFIKGATVYRSDDKGATWTQVSGLTPEQKTFMERSSNTYGWVFGQIRVDPSDPEHGLHDGPPPERVERRRQDVQGARRRRAATITACGSTRTTRTTWSTCSTRASPSRTTAGATWKDSRLTLPLAQFFNISYDMDTPFRVYGSMQDHGSFRGVVDLSRGRDQIPTVDFESAPGGEGSTHAIDPANPNIVYSSGLLRHASAAAT